MKIRVTDSFREKLSQQVAYIAQDSQARARKFKNEVLNSIRDILPSPYKHRQSIYFDDPNIRDLIFKGYTIVFRINKREKHIEVFGFVKYQERPTER